MVILLHALILSNILITIGAQNTTQSKRVSLFLLAQQRHDVNYHENAQDEPAAMVGQDVCGQIVEYTYNELFALFHVLPDPIIRARILCFETHWSMQKEFPFPDALQQHLLSKGVVVEHYSRFGADHYHVLEISWFKKNISEDLDWTNFRELTWLINLDLDQTGLTDVDLAQLSDLQRLTQLSFCNNDLSRVSNEVNYPIAFDELPDSLKTLWLDAAMLREYADSMPIQRHIALSEIFVVNDELYPELYKDARMLAMPLSLSQIVTKDSNVTEHTLKRLDILTLFSILPDAETRKRVLGFEGYQEMLECEATYSFAIESVDAHFETKGIRFEMQDGLKRINEIIWDGLDITRVNWRHLRDLTYLRRLSLVGNTLSVIELRHLSDLEQLAWLRLSHNLITGTFDLALLPKNIDCVWIGHNCNCIVVGFESAPPSLRTYVMGIYYFN